MAAQNFTPDDTVSAILGRFRIDLGNYAGPFGLLVQFCVKDGVEAQVVSGHFSEARLLTLRDTGCFAFDLSRHANDSRRFAVYEKWINLAALDAHLRKPHASKLRNAFNQLIDGFSEFTVLIPTDSQLARGASQA